MSSDNKHSLRVIADRNDRDLWGAVVLQAKADIESEPMDSIEFAQAVAFFTSSGEWAQSRTLIGDFLNLHSDDLEVFGRRCIDDRRASEGLDLLSQQQHRNVRVLAAAVREPERPPEPAPSPQHTHLPRPQPLPLRVNPFFPRGVYTSPSTAGASLYGQIGHPGL